MPSEQKSLQLRPPQFVSAKEKLERHEPITVDDLLGALTPDHFSQIDGGLKQMRESFICPYIVRDYDEFKETVFKYYVCYHKLVYNTDVWQVIENMRWPRSKYLEAGLIDHWKSQAYEFLLRLLGGYDALRTFERNATTGRDGGMIAVIDAFTDAMNKQLTETYIDFIFIELIAPSDYKKQLRLADDLLKRFGHLLFPGEELQPSFMFGLNLKEFFKAFMTQIHGLRRQWRY